jgi:Ca2+-binding RTX toxin-like protein
MTSAALLANDADPDAGDTFAIGGFDAITAQGNAVSMDATGNLVFDIGTRYESLGAGQTITDTFSYTIADSSGATGSAQVSMDITGVNDAPVSAIPLADQAATQNAVFSYQLPLDAFTDIDTGDTLTLSAKLADGQPLPGWLSFDATTQIFSGTPGNADVGNLNLLVTATDSGGSCASSSFTLLIANANNAPILASAVAGQVTNDGIAFSFTVPSGTFTDIDAIYGDTLSYSATLSDGSALPSWLSFDAVTQVFSGIAGQGDLGSLQVTVIAVDQGGLAASGSFRLDVAPHGDVILSGTAGADTLTGYSGNDMLDGGAGADTMLGGAGNDTYVVDNAGDVLEENAGEGTDMVQSSISYALGANVEKLILTGTASINGTGNDMNNTLTGNEGANTIIGGAGVDTMLGGAGDDTYVVDNVGDLVSENLDEGTDIVQSSVTYTLAFNIENLMLTGTAAINGTGNAFANLLIGNIANNTLSGGTGADTMIGGLGGDNYFVDNVGDSVIELANEGSDTVFSSVNWTLGANVDGLYLTGSAAINAIGNELNNNLFGSANSAANILTGGLGNDTYYVGAGDIVVENAGEGTDTVYAYVDHTLGVNFENLYFGASTAANLTGNDSANSIVGGAGNNLLIGLDGNDILMGSGGNDLMQGGSGNDNLNDTSGKNLFDGGAGLDTLTGGTGNEFFTGGAGNDTITTGTGADIIAFNRGNGQDILNGSVGTDNSISLGGGIQYSDLALSKSGNDLILEVGSNEQITLKNYKSVLNLQVVADAMAAFDPASADPMLNKTIQDFDFTAIVASFDQARGANATFLHWNAMNSLLDAHLSASDTDALGGDLAHQYGKNGSFSGMNLTAAQNVINAPQFGAQVQTLNSLQGLQGGLMTLAA